MRKRQIFVVLLAVVGTLLLRTGPAAADTPCVPGVGSYTLYLKFLASDSHSGCNATTDAIGTLVRTQVLLKEWQGLGLLQGLDIYIRFDSTVAFDPWDMDTKQLNFKWTFSNAPNHTYFLPMNYTPPTDKTLPPNCPSIHPLFRGPATGGHKYWLWVEPAQSPSYLDFLCLDIKQYPVGGLTFQGGSYNTVRGVLFYKIGNKYAQGTYAYGLGGITTGLGSSNNYISYSTFDQLQNTNGPGDIHGVYLSGHSSYNTITENQMTAISGDPLRARDDSNNNWFTWNDMWATGSSGFFGEWYDTATECTSRGNHIYDNWTGAPSNKWTGPTRVGFTTTPLALWYFYDGQSNPYIAPHSCATSPTYRVYTSGNDNPPNPQTGYPGSGTHWP